MPTMKRTISTIGSRSLSLVKPSWGRHFACLVGVSLLAIALAGCGSLWNTSQPALPVALAQFTPFTPVGVTPFVPASPQVRMGLTLVPLELPVVTPSPPVSPTLIPASEDTALSLLILHTSDTRGYVAPCG